MLKCSLCPKKCGAIRPEQTGLCGASSLKVARAAPHYYEEPPISGTRGSGAVFFSGCPMSCVFCQNTPISKEAYGKEISVKQLADIFKRLCDTGCHNINLVSPTPYVPEIIKALELAKPDVSVVYNSSGYERVETLKALEGYVSIYLPDFKYADDDLSRRYSGTDGYLSTASAALTEMIRQCGGCEYDAEGIMKKGVIVRHLVLPSNKENSINVLRHLHKNYDKDVFLLSLMAQYVPMYGATAYSEINRRLTRLEYRRVSDTASELGFHGFLQSASSSVTSYTPDFDLTGVDII